MGPKYNDWYPFIRRKSGHRETQEQRPGEDGGGVWADAASSQGMPRPGGSHQQREEAEKAPEPSEGARTALLTP